MHILLLFIEIMHFVDIIFIVVIYINCIQFIDKICNIVSMMCTIFDVIFKIDRTNIIRLYKSLVYTLYTCHPTIYCIVLILILKVFKPRLAFYHVIHKQLII